VRRVVTGSSSLECWLESGNRRRPRVQHRKQYEV
jgi:hypothetical protein